MDPSSEWGRGRAPPGRDDVATVRDSGGYRSRDKYATLHGGSSSARVWREGRERKRGGCMAGG